MKKNGSEMTRVSEKLCLVLAIGFSVFLFHSAISAQMVGSPDRGYKAGNSYSISNIESVNLSGGNVGMNIPLASLPAGRGTAPGFGISLAYDSKLWNAEQKWETDGVDQYQNQANYTRNLLNQTDEGGWHVRTYYRLNVVDRNGAGNQEECYKGNTNYSKNSYRWRVEMQTPGGGSITFRPAGTGFTDFYNDGFFQVDLNGYIYNQNYAEDFQGQPNCQHSSTQATTAGMTYYSTNGSGIRLFIPYNSALHNQSTNGERNWKMYFPDGRMIEHLPPSDTSVLQKITDRNGSYVTVKNGMTHNGMTGTKIQDQLGRFIFLGGTSNGDWKIIQAGAGGEELETTIKWKPYWVKRNYRTYDLIVNVNIPLNKRTADVVGDFYNVDKIILPAQAGSLEYEFDYHADETQPTVSSPDTNGWGELASVKIPSGARAEYEYDLPTNANTLTQVSDIIKNSIVEKTLKYDETYDGQTTQKTETWQYDINDASAIVTAPDGSLTSQGSYNKDPMLSISSTWKAGLVNSKVGADGTLVEKIWEQNGSQTATPIQPVNPYVKTEFTSITNQAGQLSLTAIKDYFYDQNMNLLEVREYDWVSYSLAHPNGSNNPPVIPSGATLKRKTVNEYYNQALAMGSTTPNSNYYADPSSPRLLNLIKSTEVRDGNNTPVSRSEFFYDSTAGTSATGNLTETRTWDSAKGGTTQAYSNPLTTSNSISVPTQYDGYGNPTLTTDARGYQTQITYGSINGYPGLYPTQIISAYTTSIAQTMTAEYDFSTGLAKKTIAHGNTTQENVSSETTYDALGRPTKVAAATGTTLEVWTQTEYNDAARRVITRSDLFTKGDGKKIAVQHYDQLGRVRLARNIENAATEDPTNEQHGIKVQTRYLTGNPYSYQLTSNPYRANYSYNATSEPQMGWTRSETKNNGKHSEVEPFTGVSLPAPFTVSNPNTNSTGKVQTDMDADRSLVTDQAGKQRISRMNALGQLTDVWEVTASDSQTTAISFPNQSLAAGYQTSYEYDTLNNLKKVIQGTQQTNRTFSYSSLSRLLSAFNPESGTIAYEYDNNGNLTKKIDARSISTSYTYDALNRVTLRDYSDLTPDVTYTYDVGTNARGELTKVSSTISMTEYTGFDLLGRVTAHKQTTDGDAYTTDYSYNLSGGLVEQTYPSGRVVKNVLDADGELLIVQSKKNASAGYWNYASHFSYTAVGAVSSMQLGNGKWESTQFNSRLQPIQIALGTVQNGTDKLKLDFNYGTTQNNGNMVSQQITVPTVGQSSGFTATQTYTYDALNRLKSAEETIPNQTGWKQTFLYDRYGNRNFDTTGSNTTTLGSCPTAQCNPTFDASNNRFTTGQGYTYDLAGNITADAQGRTFVYDAENKQKSVSNTGGTLGTYFYDGDGKRVKKVAGAATTIFVYDATGKLVAEYANQTSSTPQVSYLTSDHLGSPRINTDANGAVTTRHDYLPFGEEIGSTQTALRSVNLNYVGDDVRQKYTAYERDDETDLDFAQARMYTNKLGRFSTTDPIIMSDNRLSDPQQINLYIYVRNNPLKFIDPTGEDIYQLGQESEDNIRQSIKNKESELKNDKKNKQLKDELKSLNNALKIVRQGNKVVGAWLSAAQENGELKDVNLSDLKITTDPATDLAPLDKKVDPAASEEIRKDPATIAETIGTQIYVFTPSNLYQDTSAILAGTQFNLPGSTTSVGKGDVALIGGSFLIHERKHVTDNQARNPRSEIAAYGVQLSFLNRPDIVKKFRDNNYRKMYIAMFPKATY